MFFLCHLNNIWRVQKHAKDHERDYPNAAKEMNENMYVEDVLSGFSVDDRAL